jgi:hypothetical protein
MLLSGNKAAEIAQSKMQEIGNVPTLV